MITELTGLAKKAHQINRNNGFWDEVPPLKQCIALAIGELFEALEADRVGKTMTKVHPDEERRMLMNDLNVHFDPVLFKVSVKDTVEDELADVVIRCMDTLIGHYIDSDDITAIHAPTEFENISEFIMSTISIIMWQYNKNNISECLQGLISCCYSYASFKGMDLDWHIRMKMAYNATRERKHGKSY
ncbi:hypothetical protein BWI93_19245 [Siphonobacter sp. BAB-5385]|uniref:hypothetical protein n=1 Tax=Siphonobacter sp. BAB-5385 TaxID=1864822 RepID=UPI000B9E4782|nr:hypothetical protein [Siphonobacter sp. BAB-5385]OZI06617.1 hypothetical protein BWI93_19245 [Siphonobacter sp. BAB-5385]